MRWVAVKCIFTAVFFFLHHANVIPSSDLEKTAVSQDNNWWKINFRIQAWQMQHKWFWSPLKKTFLYFLIVLYAILWGMHLVSHNILVDVVETQQLQGFIGKIFSTEPSDNLRNLSFGSYQNNSILYIARQSKLVTDFIFSNFNIIK